MTSDIFKRYEELMAMDPRPPVYETLAAEFNTSVRTAQRRVQQERTRPLNRMAEKVSSEATRGTIEVTTVQEPTNIDDMIAEFGVDERFTVTRTFMQRRDTMNGPLYTLKAWLDNKDREEMLRELRAGLLSDLRSARPLAPVHGSSGDQKLLEIGLFDLHLGNLAWEEEAGENWDLTIAERVFTEAIQGLLEGAEKFKIDRILYPIGNDFFHADTKAGTTTGGTPLDVDSRWVKMFRLGCDMQRRAIDELRTIAPVDVLVIPGNHDELSAFAMGEVLRAVYDSADDVNIDNLASLRKYYSWGQTLLGFTHGRYEPVKSLPGLMADEAAGIWGRSKWREFHIGHTHHREMVDINGTLIRTLPTLCAADAYHAKSGYTGAVKAAEAYIYDKFRGLQAVLHHQR